MPAAPAEQPRRVVFDSLRVAFSSASQLVAGGRRDPDEVVVSRAAAERSEHRLPLTKPPA